MPITSIWDNDFYIKGKPLPLWSFEVNFTDFGYNDEEQILNKAVISCKWPEKSVSTIDTYYAGIQAKFPGRLTNSGELIIKFNEMVINDNLSVSNILNKIFEDNMVNLKKYFLSPEDGIVNNNFPLVYKRGRIIELKIYKSEEKMTQNINGKNPIKIIKFYNVMLTKIGEVEFSYEEEDSVMTRDATFTYDYFIEE